MLIAFALCLITFMCFLLLSGLLVTWFENSSLLAPRREYLKLWRDYFSGYRWFLGYLFTCRACMRSHCTLWPSWCLTMLMAWRLGDFADFLTMQFFCTSIALFLIAYLEK